jgi:DNA mismatch repair protein MLH1
MSDITTPVSSSTKSNIALLYGSALANDLIELPKVVLKPEDRLGATLRGWISSANSSWTRKGGWIIFINSASLISLIPLYCYKAGTMLITDRLVDSARIKKAVDSLYTTYLPKGASPWFYLRSVQSSSMRIELISVSRSTLRKSTLMFPQPNQRFIS